MWANKKTEKKLLEIANKQGGYFTSLQAFNAGYNYRLQHYHKSKKHWVEIERGLFRIANSTTSQFDDLIRWSLWSRDKKGNPQAVISHESALVVHELGDVMPAKIHITVPPKFRKEIPDGIICHKENIKSEDIEKHDDFNITSPLKTIIDVIEDDISLEQLEQIVKDALDKGLVRPINLQKARMSTKTRSKISIVLTNIKKNPF